MKLPEKTEESKSYGECGGSKSFRDYGSLQSME